jgi:hypothetical protein
MPGPEHVLRNLCSCDHMDLGYCQFGVSLLGSASGSRGLWLPALENAGDHANGTRDETRSHIPKPMWRRSMPTTSGRPDGDTVSLRSLTFGHPDVETIATTGGLDALNRLSTTFGHLGAVLAAHLRLPVNEPERLLVDRVATMVGTVLFAVRLSRLKAQPGFRNEASGDTEMYGGCASPIVPRLAEADVEIIHRAQWIAVEACFRFLTEWEDVQVRTEAAAGRLKRDLEELVQAVQGVRQPNVLLSSEPGAK